MSDVSTITFSVFLFFFPLVTVLGFVAARWRRAKALDNLDEWGLGGRGFGTFVAWFLIGGDLYTAYTFVEAQQSKVASLLVKFGPLAFVLFVSTTYALDLQLLGGVWILQTCPAIVIGLFTGLFHPDRPARRVGGRHGLRDVDGVQQPEGGRPRQPRSRRRPDPAGGPPRRPGRRGGRGAARPRSRPPRIRDREPSGFGIVPAERHAERADPPALRRGLPSARLH